MEGRNDPGIRGVAHGAGAGNERSAPVCIAPPALLGVCCGCRGGRGARRGGGGSEHLEEPRLVGAAAAGGELCRSQRCGNLKRRWLGTRLHERWHWGRAQPPRPPPPLRVREAKSHFWLPLQAIPRRLLQPWRGRSRGGHRALPAGTPSAFVPRCCRWEQPPRSILSLSLSAPPWGGRCVRKRTLQRNRMKTLQRLPCRPRGERRPGLPWSRCRPRAPVPGGSPRAPPPPACDPAAAGEEKSAPLPAGAGCTLPLCARKALCAPKRLSHRSSPVTASPPPYFFSPCPSPVGVSGSHRTNSWSRVLTVSGHSIITMWLPSSITFRKAISRIWRDTGTGVSAGTSP